MNHQTLTQQLDTIASHLESIGMVKEAHDLDVVSNTIEKQANVQTIMQRAKALLSKIPSAKLMDPAQAKAVLQDAQQKDPQGTRSLLDEVMQTLQGTAGNQPMTGLEAGEKEAAWGSLLKGLTNPRVLIAVLSLLVSTGSALGATPGVAPKVDTEQVQIDQSLQKVLKSTDAYFKDLKADTSLQNTPAKGSLSINSIRLTAENEAQMEMLRWINQIEDKSTKLWYDGALNTNLFNEVVSGLVKAYNANK